MKRRPIASPAAPERSARRTSLLLALACLLSGPVGAQPAATPPNASTAPAAPRIQTQADPKTDRRCLQCHGRSHIGELAPAERRSMIGTQLDADAAPTGPMPTLPPLTGKEPATRPSLFVKGDALKSSIHADLKCVDCHQDAATLPHSVPLNKATCAASCHGDAAKAYDSGSHRQALLRNDPKAPTCASCHGGHDILKISDRRAAPNKLNSLHLCGDCHATHSPNGSPDDPAARVSNYLDSAHARGITKSGLPMAATCADCHNAHAVKPSKDPDSTVNRSHIPETCGKCHVGVVETYATSVHGKKHADGNEKAAVCTDCHTAHQITLASTPHFMTDVISECGRCHDSPDATGERVGTYYQTYANSYHGQVTRLGNTRAARCADCHGAHDIKPLSDPTSRVSQANLVQTCSSCHPGANANFVKFDPHANHRDSKNYPILHGVWLYFMVMMSSVFTFFGLHTILWFFRARRERRRLGLAHHHHPPAQTAIRRFTRMDRINHFFVALTFFGLTATGIPLVFSDNSWARPLINLLGGVETAGLIHRFFAILLIINFGAHFASLGWNFLHRKCTAREWIFGPNSLAPRWKDAKDIFAMFRWFFGRGRPPKLDRWTYWEKFDYWAEVGGSMIIGGSGLLLWFPVLASKVLPGWTFNIAMIVHGYEALLAIGFIFTIHFFNAHLRPGAFPVDEVIFHGTLPEHELKEQRPEEYERLVRTGKLESLRVKAPDPARRPFIVLVAVASVGFGLLLLGFIIAGGLF
jgi:cytochrome b subunit of formate dehydrogenase